jgi:hypothetical protein
MAAKAKKKAAPKGGKKKVVKLNAAAAKRADAAYKKQLEVIVKDTQSARKFSLEYYWRQGRRMHNILRDPNQFKARTVQQLAADAGWGPDNLTSARHFYKSASRSQVQELQKVPTASWNVVSRWARMPEPEGNKDAKTAKDAVYASIIAGTAKYKNIDEEIRKRTKKGPKEPRKPATAVGMLRKVDSQSKAMASCLAWTDQLTKKFQDIEDVSVLKSTRTFLKTTVKSMKEMRDQLSKSIEKFEGLSS